MHEKDYPSALITCEKNGHQSEYLKYICLNTMCRNECLCCKICKQTKHKDHITFALNTLFNDLIFKT